MQEKRVDRATFATSQWRREKPELDFLAMELIGRIGEASKVIRTGHIEPLFAHYGLQTGAFDVLATLRRAGRNEQGLYALTPSQMYDATMVSSGGMTNRLDRLEKAKLIARHPNPDDRRGTIVALTDKGLTLIEEVVDAHLANEQRIVSPLSRNEQEQLSSLIAKLLSGVEAMDPPEKGSPKP
ncbi:MarR family winged helix-turn-helix transcriptional regulator [Cohaesibacter celericrescens]|uniref:MarR family transcriptional regulator n=1 Tax=Cohaesibacter celericrescens TaxID=2067669 RepID=A0A2N5XKM2_9HYPH|nr:MarR family transcriptional regulator [Cohaesibacter celericrescens]PLW74988.1 MarR family transcriptional regulator [Cohaesibacter celericrescens]